MSLAKELNVGVARAPSASPSPHPVAPLVKIQYTHTTQLSYYTYFIFQHFSFPTLTKCFQFLFSDMRGEVGAGEKGNVGREVGNWVGRGWLRAARKWFWDTTTMVTDRRFIYLCYAFF